MATKKHDPDTLDDLQGADPQDDPVQKKYEAEALAEQKRIDEAAAAAAKPAALPDATYEAPAAENDEVAQRTSAACGKALAALCSTWPRE